MLTRHQIVQALRNAGVAAGDHLLVHSSLKSVGPIEGDADGLIDGLLDAVGPGGTLAMPSFNYTRPLAVPYWDPRATPGRTGALTEVFRARADVVRSIHPTHSVLARGPRAREFTEDHMGRSEAFGVGSPLDRLAQAGAWSLLIGITHTGSSMIHVGEAHARIVKFFWNDGPLPIAKVRLPDGRIIDHQIDCTASCSMAFNAVDLPLRRRRRIIDLNLGRAQCYLMRGLHVIEAVAEVTQNHPGALFCTRADCRPCTLGRKHMMETQPR